MPPRACQCLSNRSLEAASAAVNPGTEAASSVAHAASSAPRRSRHPGPTGGPPPTQPQCVKQVGLTDL
eukprot:752448-Hanusia_phi.AAC.1